MAITHEARTKVLRNAEIVRRRKAGQYPFEIAREMKLSRNAVIGVCNRAGLCNPSDRLPAAKKAGCPSRKGERNPNSKLTLEVIRKIRTEYKPYYRGRTMAALARRFRVHLSTVRRLLYGETWTEAA